MANNSVITLSNGGQGGGWIEMRWEPDATRATFCLSPRKKIAPVFILGVRQEMRCVFLQCSTNYIQALWFLLWFLIEQYSCSDFLTAHPHSHPAFLRPPFCRHQSLKLITWVCHCIFLSFSSGCFFSWFSISLDSSTFSSSYLLPRLSNSLAPLVTGY